MRWSLVLVLLACIVVMPEALARVPIASKKAEVDNAEHPIDYVPEINEPEAPETTNNEETLRDDTNHPFTFDDIFNSSLDARSFSVRWIKGQDVYTYKEDGNLYYYNVTDDKTEILVPSSVFDELGATEYEVSSDMQYVLLGYEVESLWRHSFLAKYKVLDRQASPNGTLVDFPNDVLLKNRRLQLAKWAASGSGLVFVSGNNMYYQAHPNDNAQQFTFTGRDPDFFNGHADWLYEEEILGTHDASWFSDDSSHLVYASFDDSNVPIFRFPYYGPKEGVYGTTIEIPYPKAGDLSDGNNTKASLHVANLNNLGSPRIKLEPPASLSSGDHYFTKVSWRDENTVTVVWSNRTQNHTITTVCNIHSGACNENFEYIQVGGWIDPDPHVIHIENGGAYLTIMPKDVLSAGSWNHLAHVTAPPSGQGVVTYLTDGEEDVKDIEGFHPVTNNVYYRTTAGDPRIRHLYRVGTPLADPADRTPTCLTCALGPGCLYVTASFSSSGKYYVLGCLGPDIPSYTLMSTETGLLKLLENNTDIWENLQQKDLPTKQFMNVPIGGGYTAYAEVYSPSTIGSPGSSPVLVNVYGGPGSQAVDYRFSTGIETYLSSSEKAVFIRLDGRGTASRGNDFKFLLYRALGNKEIEDQILGGNQIANDLTHADESKMAIWGWSYGGFATAHALANETNVYKCGIIGAALSDRRYYDTAHTERFMGRATPEDNQAGYEDADVMEKIELFRNKSILIVHGTADDNVHFASSAQLMKELQAAEIQFRLQVYPDKNHYFSSSSRHLYRLYTEFLLNDCWAVASRAKQVKILY